MPNTLSGDTVRDMDFDMGIPDIETGTG